MAYEHQNPGKRTMANVLDNLARVCPARAVCKTPNGHHQADGLSKPFLPSVKNSTDVLAALLGGMECSVIFFSSSYKDHAQRLGKSLRAGNPALIEVPTFEKMFANYSGNFPYDTPYQAIEDQSAIIIHSSGTTGVPKPIFLTHGFLGTMDKQTYLSLPEGRHSAIPNRLSRDDLFLSTAPFFHLMGIFAQLMSIFNGTPFVYPPPTTTPLTVDALVQVIETAHPTVAVITPSLVEATCRSPSAMQTLSTLRIVCIGGAPLAPEIGAVLNENTNLVSVMGSSELGLVPSLVPGNKEDWEYFEWNPYYGVRMDACSEDKNDNLYELVIPRGETRDIHGIFHTFPHLTTEYRAKDLFSRHPTRPNLWKYEGRLDDTIILNDGTKINPVPMEKAIENHPLVSRAVVIGHRRSRTAVLVEPAPQQPEGSESFRDSTNSGDEGSSVSAFASSIWPAIEQANKLVPKGAGIGIMRIGLASADKQFRTTPKGSTQRRMFDTLLDSSNVQRSQARQRDNGHVMTKDFLIPGTVSGIRDDRPLPATPNPTATYTRRRVAVMATDKPQPGGLLQAALLETTTAASTRVAEGQRIFSPIAAFLTNTGASQALLPTSETR
ncbi:uncharacterized protein KD926_006811 [Aspergillus affinis]|uniref:uncharacterized protein n=1 Tax=Aspergillus affinis TaxID=1070780 RepID=UPI0022FDCC57|nr:uncharacterized protein KD926_006811 [Aspergillus affinis]KAI9041415.1 hypothetical protein KD926_006811 [Aspergillus affinis]